MSDVVQKAQEATARIAHKVTAGHVASSEDRESRRGSTLDPVANGLDDVSCTPAYCHADSPTVDAR